MIPVRFLETLLGSWTGADQHREELVDLVLMAGAVFGKIAGAEAARHALTTEV